MIPTRAVEFLGKGCKATGAAKGWDLSGDKVFQCSECFDYLSPSAMRDSGGCYCGNLFIDFDAHRFGADTGDDSIGVFRLVGGDGVVLRDVKKMYELRYMNHKYILNVVCGGIAMYEKEVILTEEQSRRVFDEGKSRLDDLAYQVVKGTV